MHSSALQQHSGTPQPLSVLICLDCCSLIIENNKVRSFLSCLVCCLSPWPWLSDAAVCPSPAASKKAPCHPRPLERQAVSVSCREEQAPCQAKEIRLPTHLQYT